MLPRFHLLLPAMALIALVGCAKTKPDDQGEAPIAESKPMVLDLSSYYTDRFPKPDLTIANRKSINGPQTYDGLPFLVSGRAHLYGQYDGGHNEVAARKERPDLIGIRVGRAFEELHLLHTTRWADVEGATIAYVRFRYADGSSAKLGIRYGDHVRDWQRLHSEVQEALGDRNSKVVWRGPGKERFDSTERMFKSLLKNPHPEKPVDTIDVVSSGQLASYSLSAATVANRDPSRSTTPPVPLDRPEHDFDGSFTIRVVGEDERPIAGAWVSVSIKTVQSEAATVSTPFYTAANGEGVARYPTEPGDMIYVSVRKKGWKGTSRWLRLRGAGAMASGDTVTFRLSPKASDKESTAMAW